MNMHVFQPELIWGFAILALGLAIAWGLYRSKTRNKANDRITEAATRELYRNPDTYQDKRPEFERQLRGR